MGGCQFKMKNTHTDGHKVCLLPILTILYHFSNSDTKMLSQHVTHPPGTFEYKERTQTVTRWLLPILYYLVTIYQFRYESDIAREIIDGIYYDTTTTYGSILSYLSQEIVDSAQDDSFFSASLLHCENSITARQHI